ncbi:MAG: DUF4383 domain-containing protein [Patescibacteria group bacterium]
MGKTIKVLGWIFLVLGLLGFFSNPIIGASAGTWFHADFNHNLVHLLTGLILLWVAYKASAKTASTLKTFGWIYLILAILGWILVSGTGTLLGLVEVNGGANWLHLILAVVLLWAGSKGSKASAASSMG